MDKKKQWIVVSFSGGKDSTAMLLHMMELGEHIDEVLTCDTYKEFPAMYMHIERIKALVEGAGIIFTQLRNPESFDYLMFEHEVKRRNKKLQGNVGYSWAGSKSRWCTSILKIDCINRYLRTLNQKYDVIQCIGIAADEEYRLDRKNNQQENKRHPLLEWGWDEATCLNYCYSKGFDWEGLYRLFNRVSCWCCPLQSLEELRNLRTNFPELWIELRDMDSRTWFKFRADYSVEQLEIRFAFEEERLAAGLTINPKTKEFRKALKERMNEQ